MNKKGSVLMISLWILAILVVFALSLGHRAAINLRLARYQRDRLKASYLAKAGINRSIIELKKDASDPNTNTYDSLNDPWSKGEDTNGNNIFKDIEVPEKSGHTFTVTVTDEERKININTASRQLLIALLTEKAVGEISQDEVGAIADLILTWRGETVEGLTIDTRDFKKTYFSVPEELLLVLNYFYKDNAEIAKTAYLKLKDYITVYPLASDNNLLNINTASEEILRILAISAKADEACINNIITQIKERIDNPNLGPFKSENEVILKFNENDPCGKVFEAIKESLSVSSNFFTITSHGKVGNITKTITAIYDRSGEGKIVYWHEN